MNILILLVLAILPGCLLLYYILHMDRREKEPFGLVMGTMALGAFSVIPVIIVEMLLQKLPVYGGGNILNAVTTAFIQVAWVEEVAKLGVVLLFSWRNKQFNEENDGIVYVGASALGFAMLENIFYVLGKGVVVGIMRAVTAMPLHCFTAVIMGYFVGLAKFPPGLTTDADDPAYNRTALLKARRKYIFKGFFIAYFIHGLYDALIFTNTPIGLLIIPLVIALVVFGVKFMKKGRDLSIARWEKMDASSPTADVSGIAETGPPLAGADASFVRLPGSVPHVPPGSVVNPGSQLWKIVVSRILLTLSAFVWGIIIWGTFGGVENNDEPGDIILGTVVITILPILLGVLLEVSYRKRKKIQQKFALEQAAAGVGEMFSGPPLPRQDTAPAAEPQAAFSPAPPVPQPPPYHAQQPAPGAVKPAKLWKAVLGRILLGIGALFWVFIFIGLLTDNELEAGTAEAVIVFGFIVSILPIVGGVLLELSYRKNK
ncbi:MAG: PrsW family intramembrane metalloprotease [bacterium]|nr:PrsW family intramembrane metalloprotease [bacterium]